MSEFDIVDPNLLVPDSRPKNYLVESILVIFFCVSPLGLVSLIYSFKVNSRYDNGDYQGAVYYSLEAKKWLYISIVIGIMTCGTFSFYDLLDWIRELL